MANDPADGHHLTINGTSAACTCGNWSYAVYASPELPPEKFYSLACSAHTRHLNQVRTMNRPGRPTQETCNAPETESRTQRP